LSGYSYERALILGLIGRLSSVEEEEFKREVQEQLGLAPGQDCDTICGAMSDQDFRQFIEFVKGSLLRKKRRFLKEEPQVAIYA
jgi:hypothetical protein